MNINSSTLDITFEWYNETLEEYESIIYNQTLSEFEARHIAVEPIYPYDSSSTSDIFDLSQDYSNAQDLDFSDGFNQFSSPTMGTSEPLYWDVDNPLALGNDILSAANYPGLITNNLFSQDFRLDSSWETFSGLFSEGTEPQFDRRDDLNLDPTWMEDSNENGLSVFDLLSLNPPINVSSVFQSVIEDEFTSVDDSDSVLAEIQQRFVSPKIISNDNPLALANRSFQHRFECMISKKSSIPALSRLLSPSRYTRNVQSLGLLKPLFVLSISNNFCLFVVEIPVTLVITNTLLLNMKTKKKAVKTNLLTFVDFM